MSARRKSGRAAGKIKAVFWFNAVLLAVMGGSNGGSQARGAGADDEYVTF